MDSKTLRVLEFNKIIDMLRQYAASDLGKAIVDDLKPSTDINEIIFNQKETSEAVSMILKKGSLGLGGLRSVEEYIKRVNVSGVLNIEELIKIGDFLRVSRRARDYAKSESKNDSFPILEPQFNSIVPVNDLEREIERCHHKNKRQEIDLSGGKVITNPPVCIFRNDDSQSSHICRRPHEPFRGCEGYTSRVCQEQKGSGRPLFLYFFTLRADICFLTLYSRTKSQIV